MNSDTITIPDRIDDEVIFAWACHFDELDTVVLYHGWQSLTADERSSRLAAWYELVRLLDDRISDSYTWMHTPLDLHGEEANNWQRESLVNQTERERLQYWQEIGSMYNDNEIVALTDSFEDEPWPPVVEFYALAGVVLHGAAPIDLLQGDHWYALAAYIASLPVCYPMLSSFGDEWSQTAQLARRYDDIDPHEYGMIFQGDDPWELLETEQYEETKRMMDKFFPMPTTDSWSDQQVWQRLRERSGLSDESLSELIGVRTDFSTYTYPEVELQISSTDIAAEVGVHPLDLIGWGPRSDARDRLAWLNSFLAGVEEHAHNIQSWWQTPTGQDVFEAAKNDDWVKATYLLMQEPYIRPPLVQFRPQGGIQHECVPHDTGWQLCRYQYDNFPPQKEYRLRRAWWQSAPYLLSETAFRVGAIIES